MTTTCAIRHACHQCGYQARVRQGPGLDSAMFKHSRQTGCPNVAIVDLVSPADLSPGDVVRMWTGLPGHRTPSDWVTVKAVTLSRGNVISAGIDFIDSRPVNCTGQPRWEIKR